MEDIRRKRRNEEGKKEKKEIRSGKRTNGEEYGNRWW